MWAERDRREIAEWRAERREAQAAAQRAAADTTQRAGPKRFWKRKGLFPPEVALETIANAATSAKGQSFEFANFALDTTKLGRKLYRLGEARGHSCVAAMYDANRMGKVGTADASTARAIAIRRGYLSVGIENGMEGLVDGADPLFDQYRAAFMKGVEDVIDREA
jgi:hypothetical protein